jgi:hypothetical protein
MLLLLVLVLIEFCLWLPGKRTRCITRKESTENINRPHCCVDVLRRALVAKATTQPFLCRSMKSSCRDREDFASVLCPKTTSVTNKV